MEGRALLVKRLAAEVRGLVAELKRYDAALAKKPRWIVLNKIDLVSPEGRDEILQALRKALRTKAPGFCVSGVTREGSEDLMQEIQRWLDAQRIAEIESAKPDVRFLPSEMGHD